jgi:N-acetylglutamate synthase-like GNAT family acetyltransferase
MRPRASEVNSVFSGPAIRRATLSDAPSLSALLRRAFQEFEPLYTPEAFVATVQAENGIRQRIAEGPIWIAENDCKVVGTVSALPGVDSLLVRGMAVDPQARGQSLGKSLLRLTEEFARQLDLKRVSLYTTEFLLSAIHLYQASGFKFTGEKASPHGTELLRMVKTL